MRKNVLNYVLLKLLQQFENTEISFDKFNQQFGLNIQEVEEDIFEGVLDSKFDVEIDYLRSMVKVNSVACLEVTTEQVDVLLKELEELEEQLK